MNYDKEGNLKVKLGEPAEVLLSDSNLDAFGSLRTSSTDQRFDVEFIYNKSPDLIDEVTSGGATATHNSNPRDITLAIINTANGTSGALYSHYDIPYTAGNSQFIHLTGCLDNSELGAGVASIFLRSKVTGSIVETVVDQSAWNINTGVDINWSTSQIFQIDFQSLKVGRIRFGLDRNGPSIVVHEMYNDNIRHTGFWQSPSLPLYWRIYNDATYTYMEAGYGDTDNAIGFRYRITKNSSATLRAICGTVKSEGGGNLFDMPGLNRSADTGTTSKTISTSLIPVLSIRPSATFNSITNRGLYIPNKFSIQTDNAIKYALVYRPTLTGASWSSVDATNSGVEFDVSASSFTGGIVIDSDYLATNLNQRISEKSILGKTLLSLGRTGTSDILSLCAIRTGSVNASVFGSFQWREIR